MNLENINWQEVYENYPVNRDLIWLNNCGTTPGGSHIKSAINDYISEYTKRGIFATGYSYTQTKQTIQKIISGLLNCRPEEVAIIHNTSEGMNLISWGISLKPGDEIILLENEYPSNVYPWQHWEDKGIRISFVPMANSPVEFLDNVINSITPETRLMSMSSVHWCTGMPLPLKDISAICKKDDIYLVVDGAQGAGHVEIDMKGWEIDFISFSAWKWLLGPLGLGILAVTDRGLSKLGHVFKGTESVIDDTDYLPYKNELKPSAERYIYSTSSFNDWLYFKTSLEYLENIGFENVMKRIYTLSDYLIEILKNNGFNVLSDFFQGAKTGIVVAEKSDIDILKFVKKLNENGVITRERLGRLRLAPHIYNSFEQLDRVGEITKKLLKQNMKTKKKNYKNNIFHLLQKKILK